MAAQKITTQINYLLIQILLCSLDKRLLPKLTTFSSEFYSTICSYSSMEHILMQIIQKN